jgi:hypothetical protein
LAWEVCDALRDAWEVCDAEGTTVGDAKPGDAVFYHRCVRREARS